MRASNKKNMPNIDTNLITSITSFVENLDLIIKEFQDNFDKVYTLYLTTVEERNKAAKGSTLSVRMPTKSFEKVSRIYDYVSKTLNDFSKVFLHDFSDIVEIMLELNSLKEKHQMLSIELSLDKDFLNEDQVYRKENRISKVKSDYDNLVTEFEIRNKELTALKKNLARQVLIYHCLKTGRKFLLNLKGELAEFKYFIELDSKKYSDMIGEYYQLFDDQLKKLTLTPIKELNESFAPSKVNFASKKTFNGLNPEESRNLASQKTFAELNPEESAAKYRKVVEEIKPSQIDPPRSFAEQSKNFKFQFIPEVKKERKEPKKMETDATGPTLAKMMKPENEGFKFKLTVPKEPEIASSEAPRRRSAEEIEHRWKLLKTANDAPSLNLTVIENLVRTNEDSESNHVKLVNLALPLPSEIDRTKEELRVISRELNAMEKKKIVKMLYARLIEEYHDLKSHLILLKYWKKEIKIKLDSPDVLRKPIDYEFIPLENIPLITEEKMELVIKYLYETMVRNLTIDNNNVSDSQMFKKFESNYPELMMVKDFRTFVGDYKNWKRQIVKPDIDLSTEEASTLVLEYLRHEVLASMITMNYLNFLRGDFCYKYDHSSGYSEKRFYALVVTAVNRYIEIAWASNGNTLMIVKKLKKVGFSVTYEDMIAPLARKISSYFAILSMDNYKILQITMDEDRHILRKNAQEPTVEEIEGFKKLKLPLIEKKNRSENNYYQLVQKQKILEMDINESMAALISFFDNIKINISIFRREFTQAYESFTKEASASSTYQKNEIIRTNDPKHSIVTDLYKFFMNLLTNFMTSFTQEYTETLLMAIDISNLKESYKDIYMRYSNFDDMDIDHLYQLDRKVRRIIDRHNKLALKYNARIRHFETLRRNILNGTLVYNSVKKRFAVSVSDKLIRFQQIIASDVKFRRIPVNIGSVQQFPQAMENVASKFEFAEISPLGESNLRFLPRETPKGRKRKPEDSDSDKSGSEVQEERPKIKRGARRTKGFAKVKPLDARKKEVEDLMKTIVPDRCQNLLTQTLESLEAILPYKLETFVGYIKILKEDQGVAKTSTIVEEILQTPNAKFPPIKAYGLTNPEGDLNPSVKTDPPPKVKKIAQELALANEYNRLQAENDVKIIILEDGIAEIEAFGKSVDLLYLLDDSYTLTDCDEFMGKLCEFLLKAFEEARDKFPGVLKKIHINDNPPMGDLKDYHNRSSDAKELLVKRDQLECQMRNSFSLYNNAVKKRNSSISDAEIQIMKNRIPKFVETCVQNINDKIKDLEQEVKVLDAKIRVIYMEKKKAAAKRKKKTLLKIAAEAAAKAAKTAADEAVAAAATAAAAVTSGDAAGAIAAASTASAAATAATSASNAAAAAIRKAAAVTSGKAAATSGKAAATSGKAAANSRNPAVVAARAAVAAVNAANAAAASAATFGHVAATSGDSAATIPDDVSATSGNAAAISDDVSATSGNAAAISDDVSATFDDAAATSDDDDVIMADDNDIKSNDDTVTAAAAVASSVRKDSPYIYDRNPTIVSKEYRSARLTKKHASNIKSYDPEVLSKVVDELTIKIFKQVQEQTEEKKLRSRSKKYDTMGDCRNIHLMNQYFDNEFKKFLEDWKDKIKIDSMDITDYKEISEIQKKLENIEKTGKLVKKSSEIALSLVLRRSFDDDNEELVNLQIEYLSLALIMVYLQVNYYDYQRDKVIQSKIENKDAKVDELMAEIEYADKCLQFVIVKLEKMIPE
ncbi:hypothetical protein KQX54_015318 [Cotesia glomerata]|uniref:Uncharacterized protein n=1 Tax=Cotesia glomerata TaxID=32391 RepID=A0AAV7ITI2_COTGL|nr:hypothetical protein KQX54_015318 [Cotesia glomerata]